MGRERWGRQLISSRTIGAPCALRKLQKGEGTTGEWSRAPRGGRRRRRFGNGKGQRRGGGDLELAARDRVKGAKASGLAAGAAGRRGGGTLLRGFVETRVDAADARIPPLSAFSHVQKDFAKVKAWAPGQICPLFALSQTPCRETSRTQSDDPTTTQCLLVSSTATPRPRSLHPIKFTPPRRPRRRRPPWRPRSPAGRGSPSRPRTRRPSRSAGS